ncbi:hypothetical protein [Actinorhabdospora filicis]|nr:hypothetical protein [Actinorhabdospora filicis]
MTPRLRVAAHLSGGALLLIVGLAVQRLAIVAVQGFTVPDGMSLMLLVAVGAFDAWVWVKCLRLARVRAARR